MYLVCIENNTQMYVVNAKYMTFKYINCFNVCILYVSKITHKCML